MGIEAKAGTGRLSKAQADFARVHSQQRGCIVARSIDGAGGGLVRYYTISFELAQFPTKR